MQMVRIRCTRSTPPTVAENIALPMVNFGGDRDDYQTHRQLPIWLASPSACQPLSRVAAASASAALPARRAQSALPVPRQAVSALDVSAAQISTC
jgi:hypothetical protein